MMLFLETWNILKGKIGKKTKLGYILFTDNKKKEKQMRKDPEPEPMVYSEEQSRDTTPEYTEWTPDNSLPERLYSWIESVDC